MAKPEAVEVRCFGLPDKNVRDIKTIRITTAEILDPKRGRWREENLVDYHDDCPVCGTLMHVLAIRGTTWLACCSEGCYKKLDEKKKELGTLGKAFEYFRKKRENG